MVLAQKCRAKINTEWWFQKQGSCPLQAAKILPKFQNVDFEMDDVSLRRAIESRDEAYIKSIIRPKIKQCRYCLCLVGENTHRSRKWIPWEIGVAREEGKVIIAMRFKDTPNAETPKVLLELGVGPFDWDLEKLDARLSG